MEVSLFSVATPIHHTVLTPGLASYTNNKVFLIEKGRLSPTLVSSWNNLKPLRLHPLLCSSSLVEQEEAEEETPLPCPSTDSLPVQSESATQDAATIPPGGCKTCGRQEIEKGCNGEGRIQGGIATVPGFIWWPIKAYRPCPGFVASGGRYRRQGQSMDEVAFGRTDKGSSSSLSSSGVESKKTKEGSKEIQKVT